ncbi:MAG: hypothetical protein ACRDHE_10080, partial [Ktedonobacterales bacterium]
LYTGVGDNPLVSEIAGDRLASGDDGGAGCGLSFAAATLVATPRGERPIVSLKAGDQVSAYDPATGKVAPQRVARVYLNHDHDRLDVTLALAAKPSAATGAPTTRQPARDAETARERVRLVTGHGRRAPPDATAIVAQEVLHTTANHPWLTADAGWKVAGTLAAVEPVRRVDGGTAVVVSLRVVPGAASMWDLTVSNVHTFAVGNGAYVVHNCPDGPSGGGSDGAQKWSSPTVAKAAHALDEGANDVTVNSRSEAEELFLGRYAGDGYRNTTGFKGPENGFWDEFKRVFGGKAGTYHWDEGLDDAGRVSGHGEGNPHGGLPHLQIHTFEGPIIRIFFLGG